MKNFADVHVHMSEISFDMCERFLREIAAQGTTHAALQSLTYRSPAYNLSVLYWKEHFREITLSAFGMVHNEDFYRDIPYENQAEALLQMGCDGIKFMYSPDARKRLGHGIDDARYDRMFSMLEERNVPMLIHVNDPESMWVVRELSEYEKARGWGYFDGTYLSKEEIYRETFAMLKKHPRLRITFAHFFFLSCFMEEAERVMETYPNVSFDLTPGWEMYVGFSQNIEGWQGFFEKYSDRILFGTDTNNNKTINDRIYQLVRTALTHDHSEFKMPCYKDCMIRGLDLSAKTVEKICFENYMRFTGDPVPVRMDRVLEAAERLRAGLRGREEEKNRLAAAWTEELLSRCAGKNS